jgi:superfamily II DNA or RNA helicase
MAYGPPSPATRDDSDSAELRSGPVGARRSCARAWRPPRHPGTRVALLAGMRLVFDRGTVLAEEVPPGVDLGEIAGFLWDPRVGAFRAAACRYDDVRAGLARLGVRISDSVRMPGQPPEVRAPVELRAYQEAALAAWELHGRRGIVVLPTGAGKTHVALAAIARTRHRTLCLVPTRVLLDQWARQLERMCGSPVGCYGDGAHEVGPVTVATFESAYLYMDRLGNQFDLLVVDEAHHFGTSGRDEALEMCTAAARLGLTATPPHDAGVIGRLTGLLGPIVYELAIADLAGRFLASLDVVTLYLDLEPDERRDYEELMARFRPALIEFRRLCPAGSWEDFARAAGRTPDGRRAVAAWQEARRRLSLTRAKSTVLAALLARHHDARTLVFTAGNDAAYAIAREHLIMPLTCDIGRAERTAALERFRAGELRALVSARVLNEGLDVPAADVAVIVGGSCGEREHVQRVGRLLRPAPGKRALVYELVTRRTVEVRQAQRRRRGLAPRVVAQL